MGSLLAPLLSFTQALLCSSSRVLPLEQNHLRARILAHLPLYSLEAAPHHNVIPLPQKGLSLAVAWWLADLPWLGKHQAW